MFICQCLNLLGFFCLYFVCGGYFFYLQEPDEPRLVNAIWKCITRPNCAHHVFDGGSLLHKVVWKKGMTYKDICKIY